MPAGGAKSGAGDNRLLARVLQDYFGWPKLNFLFIVLKLVKLSSLVTLLLSLGAYARLYGWQFAIARIYSLIFRETGHVNGAVPQQPQIGSFG